MSMDITNDSDIMDITEDSSIMDISEGSANDIRNDSSVMTISEPSSGGTFQFSPDADPESTSVDGYTGVAGQDTDIATLSAVAGVVAADVGQNIGASLAASTTTDQFATIVRGFILFDTSSLSGATVSSATLKLNVESKSTDLGDVDVHVVSANPASNTALAASDHSTVGSTSFGSVNTSVLTAGQTVEITLNASGIAAINTSGVTKFALRNAWDLNGVFDGTWVSGASTSPVFYDADNGVNPAPVLEVVTS